MGFFRDLLHVASISREERQDGARLFGAAEHLGEQLKIQLDMAKERAGGRWLPHTSGALGYCYGWCDEGLKTCGFDINQRRIIGAPVLLKVFGTLWPGDQQGCTVYIFAAFEVNLPGLFGGSANSKKAADRHDERPFSPYCCQHLSTRGGQYQYCPIRAKCLPLVTHEGRGSG